MKVEMPTSRIEWTTVLGRLEQTVAALSHANRSDISEGERAQVFGGTAEAVYGL